MPDVVLHGDVFWTFRADENMVRTNYVDLDNQQMNERMFTCEIYVYNSFKFQPEVKIKNFDLFLNNL